MSVWRFGSGSGDGVRMPAVALPPLGPAHHHIDPPVAAGAREQPLAPIEHAMAFPARPNFAAAQSQQNPEARGSPSGTRTSEPTAGAASHPNLGPTGGRGRCGDFLSVILGLGISVPRPHKSSAPGGRGRRPTAGNTITTAVSHTSGRRCRSSACTRGFGDSCEEARQCAGRLRRVVYRRQARLVR